MRIAFPFKSLSLGLLLIMMILFSSCGDTKKVAYFSDVQDSTLIASSATLEPVIQKKDILSIAISSLSADATEVFNTPNLPLTPSGVTSNTIPQTAGYLVADDGNIRFPVLGAIHAAGLTQKELSDSIAHLLVVRKLLYDPIVNIRFLNFRVAVLGEVNHPGIVYAPSEQMSILEAIGAAGDLTIYGMRDRVLLIRQEGDQKLVKRLDLNSVKLLHSPYFYLKSNDVIYVQPNQARVNSGTVVQARLPIALSGLSLLIVLLVNVFKL